MTQQIINVGTTADDKTGDTLRAGFQKANANFTEIYTGWTISSATAQLVLNKSGALYGNNIWGQTNGSTRWVLVLGTAEAETGGNAGSNLIINNYTDSGAGIGTPFSITRSNATVNFNTTLSCNTMNCNSGSMTVDSIHCTGGLQVDGNGNVNNTLTAYQINTSYETAHGNMQVNGDVNTNHFQCNGAQSYGQFACNTVQINTGGWLYVSYLQSFWSGLTYNWVDGNQWSWRYIDSYGDGVTLAAAWINNATNYPVLGADSDERLKQGITQSTYDCLATLDRLPRHQFHWKDHTTPARPKPTQAKATAHVPNGFIAQRVHEVAPHLARKGDTLLIGTHSLSDPQQPGSLNPNPLTPWSINTVNMLALLVGALQQLTARIEALEAAR